MPRKILLWLAVLLLVFVVPAAAKSPRFHHADKNKDGVVDRKEWQMEKTWEHKQKSKVNSWWEKRADTNNDGVVDAGELAAWKKLEKERLDLNHDGVIDAKERRLCWRHARSKVNTELEKKYDANGNGWLEESEVRAMLKDKRQLIQTHGKAKVDNPIEAEYDKNGDGIIDANEAENLKGDLK
jgi:Ca2+-binding EF-hand superfamily protein